MVTTAIFAEIVVAGLQALVWITLTVLAVFGTDWIDPSQIKDWAVLVTLLLLATAYMVGVLIDRLADYLTLKPLNVVFAERPVDKPAEIADMRMALLAQDNGVVRFLEYQRSKLRVARATLLNLILLVPALTAFLALQTDASAATIVIADAVVLLAAAVTVAVFRGISCAYVWRLSDAYRRSHNLPHADRAAAVCCRVVAGRLNVLLVGGVDLPTESPTSRQTLPEAARAAAKQVGVRGAVGGRRLGTYRRDDETVVAYLVRSRDGTPTAAEWHVLEHAPANLDAEIVAILATARRAVLRR